MENSTRILFDFDDPKNLVPEWFVATDKSWIGPLSAVEVYSKVVNSEFTWAHYAWKAGQSDWKRICEIKVFNQAVPVLPKKGVTHAVKAASKESTRSLTLNQQSRKLTTESSVKTPPRFESIDSRLWFLHYNNTQFGPFSVLEVNRAIQIGKIHGKVYCWREGFSEWVRLEEVVEFEDALKGRMKPEVRKSQRSSPSGTRGVSRGLQDKKEDISKSITQSKTNAANKRKNERKPFVAKIWASNDQTLITGVCRDISIGGMQVLTDKIPGDQGTRIKLNISPPKGIRPFVAEGVIVRVLEDGRGFSFRFDKLNLIAKKSIQAFIESSDGNY